MLIGHIFKEEKKQEFNLLFNAHNSVTFVVAGLFFIYPLRGVDSNEKEILI
jgi:hypothetical protein